MSKTADLLRITAASSQNGEEEILERILAGQRLGRDDALFLLQKGDFRLLGRAADQLRQRKNPAGKVSYTAFRIVNYTNICNVSCSFCSFMDEVDSNQGYTLSAEQIFQKIEHARGLDVQQLFLQGGVNPHLPFTYYLDTLSAIRQRYPNLHIRAFSPVEVLFMEKISGLPLATVLEQLKQAGLDSLPGAGAEILSDRMRQLLSSKKASKEEWLRVMRTAGQLGIASSTNMVWGSEETPAEIIEHLEAIRDLQDQTGQILSFVPWTFQQQTSRFRTRHVPAWEYLKVLALSRLFLDNIPHIEASLLVAGRQLGELALFFGADDINSPVIEENVLRSFGLKNIAEAEEFIAAAGFEPVRRNFNFEMGKKA